VNIKPLLVAATPRVGGFLLRIAEPDSDFIRTAFHLLS
jgi:hypothetical protein